MQPYPVVIAPTSLEAVVIAPTCEGYSTYFYAYPVVIAPTCEGYSTYPEPKNIGKNRQLVNILGCKNLSGGYSTYLAVVIAPTCEGYSTYL